MCIHNSAESGSSRNSLPVKPMQCLDHSYFLKLMHLSDVELDIIGTSLLVEWDTPVIDKDNKRLNLVGNSRSIIKNYLIR